MYDLFFGDGTEMRSFIRAHSHYIHKPHKDVGTYVESRCNHTSGAVGVLADVREIIK